MSSTLEEMHTGFVVVSGRDTLGRIREAIEKREARYVVVALPDGTFAARSVVDPPRPLIEDLRAQEDLIGEEALAALTPAQLPDLFPPVRPVLPGDPEREAQRKLEESGGGTVIVMVGGILHRATPASAEPDVPPPYEPEEALAAIPLARGKSFAIPALPGEKRVFGGREARAPRTCPACGRRFRYYKPVVEGGQVTGYACPYDDCRHLKDT